jgi:hypothetical protein
MGGGELGRADFEVEPEEIGELGSPRVRSLGMTRWLGMRGSGVPGQLHWSSDMSWTAGPLT